MSSKESEKYELEVIVASRRWIKAISNPGTLRLRRQT
jgi:hypothetical protein